MTQIQMQYRNVSRFRHICQMMILIIFMRRVAYIMNKEMTVGETI